MTAFCPLPHRFKRIGIDPRIYRIEDGTLERRCSRCAEWLPADTEFFHSYTKGLMSWCKACFNEARQERRMRG